MWWSQYFLLCKGQSAPVSLLEGDVGETIREV